MAPVTDALDDEGPMMSSPTASDDTDAIETLDAQGLLCPLPVIRVQDRVRGLVSGTLLDVLATDPGTLHDVPAWCRVHGHAVIAAEREARLIRIRIRVGG
jgi:tRNA 2-thiouridine synthesizing protein A